MANKEIPKPLMRAWAAGVFEAKCRIYEKRNELYIDMYEREPLERLTNLIGVGWVRELAPGKRQIRPTQRWQTKSLNESRVTLLFVLPLLGPHKAAQAAKMIKRIEGNPAWRRKHGTKDNS